MKTRFLLLASLCFFACQTSPPPVLELASSTAASLNDVPVRISRTQCEKLLGALNPEEAVQFRAGETVLPSQFDDLDQDGLWDEAIVLSSLPAQLQLARIPMTSVPRSETKTNLHFAKVIEKGVKYEEASFGERIQGTDTKVTQTHFQFEGPGWENDRIAFRNYFDERNGFDIFGKTTEEMVLTKVGTGDNYHDLLDWGMDILKVGNSLGSGGIALWHQDSLYRVTVPEGATYQVIVEGPLRSIFELRFPGVVVGEHRVEVVHRVSICAGVNGFSSEVITKPHREDIMLAAGIVNLASDELHTAATANTQYCYTYDQQAFLGEKLGMGLIGRKVDVVKTMMAPEEGAGVTQTYASLMRLYPDRPTPYLFIAGWEETDAVFQTQEGFQNVLEAEAAKWIGGLLFD